MKNKTIWDKTNISENYPGTTYPLTYSFIKDAYATVYPNFLALLGYNKTKIKEEVTFFQDMLGYINGEVFYNIDNWYKLIKYLPLYKYNKEFFENMLEPVKKKKKVKSLEPITLIEIKKTLFLVIRIFQINYLHKTFEKQYKNISKSFNEKKLSKLSNTELVQNYKHIEQRFFSLWSIAILNDFRVMISYGIFSRFLAKHGHEKEKEFYSQHSKPIGIDMIKNLIDIAIIVKKEGISSKKAKLKIKKYKKTYGNRTANELKLESPNFFENEQQLISLIKSYAKKTTNELNIYKQKANFEDSTLIKKLGIVEKIIYKKLKEFTIKSIHLREYYRLKRADTFNIAKKYFLEMGQRLVNEKLITKKENVFLLYKTEIIEHLSNHRLNEDLEIIANKRQNQIKEYSLKTQPKRITTTKIYETKASTSQKSMQEFKITSAGKLKNAEIILMPELDLTLNFKNKVVVTHATDPAWTVIFPLIKGIVIEVGGMLSHASIVAREVGIPCIVKENALTEFKNKDKINFDSEKKLLELCK